MHSIQIRDEFEKETYPEPGYCKKEEKQVNKEIMGNHEKNVESSSNDNKHKETVPKFIRDFLGYTTAHGMNRLGEAKGIFWRIFWSLVCLGSFFMFTYQTYFLFKSYYSKPVSTSIRLTFEKQAAFPAVTICNMNMIRQDALPEKLAEDIENAYPPKGTETGKERDRRGTKDPGPTVAPTQENNQPDTTATSIIITSNDTEPVQSSTTKQAIETTTTSSPSNITVKTTEVTPTEENVNSGTTKQSNQTNTTSVSTNTTSNATDLTPTEEATAKSGTTVSPDKMTKQGEQTTMSTVLDKETSETTSGNSVTSQPAVANEATVNSVSTQTSRYTTKKPVTWIDDPKAVTYYDTELLPSLDEVDENTLFMERFTTQVTSVSEEKLRAYGHQFEELVLSCSWRGQDCKDGNFSDWWYQSWNYKYGNCYTFNGGKSKDGTQVRILSTSKPGPTQGLLLRLDIEEEQYIGQISSEAGVRVTLHDQGTMPFPFEEGFSVSSGMSTSVGLQKTVIERVDRFGNGSCLDIDALDDDNIYRVYKNITKYTRQTCQNSCLGKTQFEDCGCSEYVYPSGSPACDAFNDTIRLCLALVHHRFNNDRLPCYKACRQPCSESIIEKTISMSDWPSLNYEMDQKNRDSNFTGDGSLILNIFYNELNYHRIEESFTYEISNLLADIGGQLGLWIGVSAITCCELLELLLLITVHLVRKSVRRYGNRVQTIKTLP